MKNLIVLLGVAAVLTGCHNTPPPPPPPPPVAVTPPPPPPPPPPPKCEALSEGCTGQNGTLARIQKSGFSLVVPNGWTYAQGEDATVASANDAILVVSTFDIGTSDANRDGAFVAIVNMLGVSPPKHKVIWSHPMKKVKVGAFDLLLWQADDVTKGLSKGSLLVFGMELPDKKWLLGGGYADSKGDSDQAIMASLQTISPSTPAPPPPPPPAAPAPPVLPPPPPAHP